MSGEMSLGEKENGLVQLFRTFGACWEDWYFYGIIFVFSLYFSTNSLSVAWTVSDAASNKSLYTCNSKIISASLMYQMKYQYFGEISISIGQFYLK